jgi:hypothetical protein
MNEYLKEQNVEVRVPASSKILSVLFARSSLVVNLITFQDVQDPNFKKASKALVCSPDPHNITPIYSSLMELISVIEKALRCDVG